MKLALKVRVLWLVLATVLSSAAAAQECAYRGEVKDSSGAAIVGAEVTGQDNATTQTDRTGHFELRSTCRTRLTVRAAGFAVSRVDADATSPVTVTLKVSLAEARTTVVAEGGAAETTSLDERDLRTAPQLTMDSRLREVPGFSLFRRTPSWSANPTTQGISLHGVGASGASRGLALMEGVPLNDPFGGWIYWGRVSPASVGSVEVSETSASELYGSDAVGGVVTMLRPTSVGTAATMETSVGDLFTPQASGTASLAMGRWTTNVVADGFRTNGYVPVPENARGAVDTVASSEHRNGGLTLERAYGGGRFFLGGNLYGESRQNGTVLQTNSATIRELQAGADWSGRAGDWAIRGFGGTEDLRQTFTSIDPTRTLETLTRDQTVPAAQAGASLLWSKAVGRNLVVAGTEARWVDGETYEWAFTAGNLTSIQRAGGAQRRAGVFGEDRIRLGGRTLVTLGARWDRWTNVNGFSSTSPLVPTVTGKYSRYEDREENAFSPKAAVSVSVNHWLTLHASGAGGFRAPTLNELYRSFRVGSVLTLSNANLKAERSVNAEGGATISLGPAGVLKASYFWTELRDAVGNVTQSVTPALITRMRDNLGRLQSQGFDASWERRFAQRWTISTAYEFVDPKVVEFSADPTLVGLWIPQVARHNATVAIGYAGSKWTTHMALRGQGKQFDDDRNSLALGGYAVVDAFVSRMLGRGVEIFFAGENLTNRRYEVGKTPVVSLGPPVIARGGLRWTVGRR